MIKFLEHSSEKPYKHFKSLHDHALENNQRGIEVISVSSYDKENKEVEARYVNLKYIINNEWIFFSNYLSPKAVQFKSHSQVSILIYWGNINTQIRMKAKIFKTLPKFSDEHFQGRTIEKNALAISSSQSKVIESYDEVAKNFYSTLKSMTAKTARPEFWGGFSFIPYYFEFWQGHENRLNKRHVFEQHENKWEERFLQP